VAQQVGGSTRRILAALLLGPLVSLLGSRKLGLMMWWKPFKKEDVATITGLLESGTVTPVIDRTFPLAEVADALRYIESGRAQGKVVITV